MIKIMINKLFYLLMLFLLIGCISNKTALNEIQIPNKITLEEIENSKSKILSDYEGKNIYKLLNILEENYHEVYPIDEPPGKLRGWSFYFHQNQISYILSVYIKYEKEYFSVKRDWELDDFLDKEITLIEIINTKYGIE